eukprot:TRINITY_DN1140_c0_g1_i2.p1 TRINITY_DN1140_c0_g1~~TRINITY_DN1140_c0_g1_i2.p1  ORF type:complete len:101 (+),score=52.14 TRINITY_DN1140_c0_g1_i2:120-422(+)
MFARLASRTVRVTMPTMMGARSATTGMGYATCASASASASASFSSASFASFVGAPPMSSIPSTTSSVANLSVASTPSCARSASTGGFSLEAVAEDDDDGY